MALNWEGQGYRGRKERRKLKEKEGRKDRMKEGRKDGKKEGRMEGKKEGKSTLPLLNGS